MEKLKLTSVRLDPETLQKIDVLAEKQGYRNRSFIIQNILRNVLSCAESEVLWQIIDTRYAYEKGYTIDFHADTQLCRQRNQQQE